MKKCLQIVVVLAVLLPAWAHSLPPGGEGVLLYRSKDTLCVVDTRTWQVSRFPESVWRGVRQLALAERDSEAVLFSWFQAPHGMLPWHWCVQAAFLRDSIVVWYRWEGEVWGMWHEFDAVRGRLLLDRGSSNDLYYFTSLDPFRRTEAQIFRPWQIRHVWWGGDTTLYLRMADSSLILVSEPPHMADSLRIDRSWFVKSVVPYREGIIRLEQKGDRWRVVRCSNIVRILGRDEMGFWTSQGKDRVLYESDGRMDNVQVGGDVVAFQELVPSGGEPWESYLRILCYSLTTGNQLRIVDLTKSFANPSILPVITIVPSFYPSLDCAFSPDGEFMYIGVRDINQYDEFVPPDSLRRPSAEAKMFCGIYEVRLSTGEIHRRVSVPFYHGDMQYVAGHTRKHWPVR